MTDTFNQPTAIHRRAFGGLVGALCMTSLGVRADTWPSRTVTIISPYPAGGSNDVVARLMADRLSKIFKQSFIVENRAGAGGIIGHTAAMRAAPDGHTLVITNNGALVVQSIVRTPPPFDPVKSFTPVMKLLDAPNFIGVPANSPFKSVGEIIAYAKKNPGKLNYSTTGVGSYAHFLGEYLKLQAGIDMLHVPGNGSAGLLTELLGARIDVVIDPVVITQTPDRVRTLAAFASHRPQSRPDVPTIQESGGPAIALSGWFALAGPAGMPRDVVEKLEAATVTALNDPDVRKTIVGLGFDVAPLPSTALANLLQDELVRYTDIKNRARISID